jgi:hypothetical protein
MDWLQMPMSGGIEVIDMIAPQRIPLADLMVRLLHFNIDPGKFHDRPSALLKEFNTGDTLFFVTRDHRLGKGRYSAKVHLVWRGRQLFEIGRILPDGTQVMQKRPWFVSGTIKRPRGKIKTNHRGETPLKAAIREVWQETRMRLRPRNLVALHAGQGIQMPVRESSVWVGMLAWELQYHFLCDLSERDEQPWPNGLIISEITGTTVLCEWDEQTTFADGGYAGAHR